ncbi:hypothetical protein QW060_09800 [Myroides ceti]|uniref:Uncharacterized protein n=1 Tax=Paenimyroides ceti TaxID=395087 RepID=A0ABT8CW76_9FLAO|nr:hypothetical protein [Paenimyroides ceti]MDN3707422.1 hypothetical protein [Paenimyroides ceti]
MKKLIITTGILLAGLLQANAQRPVSQNAIGLRLSLNETVGPEINYQRLLSDKNRLELGLGWKQTKHVDAFKLSGVYQWLWNIEGGFNWYAGVGASVGSWNDDHRDKSGAILALAGQIGVEYHFNIPLQVFVDFRPEIYLTDYYKDNNFGPDFGLGARFKF